MARAASRHLAAEVSMALDRFINGLCSVIVALQPSSITVVEMQMQIHTHVGLSEQDTSPYQYLSFRTDHLHPDNFYIPGVN